MPEEITGAELDRDIRRELRSLSAPVAASVSRHLVMAGRLLDEDPQAAWQHAQAARRFAPRLAVVREAAGLAAYRAGAYAEALAELRTARRLTGSDEHLPVMADCERGLGRPDRALALAASPEAARLDLAGRVEMRIVVSGARADLGQFDAAVVALQIPELQADGQHPWLARLRSAYADALADADRLDDARIWLVRAADADADGSTGAAERLAELEGVSVVDLEEDDLAGIPPDEREPDEAGATEVEPRVVEPTVSRSIGAMFVEAPAAGPDDDDPDDEEDEDLGEEGSEGDTEARADGSDRA